MNDWVIGKVRTNSEGKIATTLSGIGVEAYCPMVRSKGQRRTDGTREAVERPALPGYVPVREEHVWDAMEHLEHDPDFYDFLRDIEHVIATIRDSDLDPLRAMEKAEPVKFYSGPSFFLGEKVKVPYNSPHVMKAFWGYEGQVVGVKNGRYCLALKDKVSGRTLETWFYGYQLLANS
jgi:hypothetical protein